MNAEPNSTLLEATKQPPAESVADRVRVNSPSDVGAESFVARIISPAEIDSRFVSEWESLEGRAIEPNAFLSPHFIRPALKHLTPDLAPIVMVIESRDANERRLFGLGVFERVAASRLLPLPHLRAYRSIHSFLDGLLIDRTESEAVIDALFGYLKTQTHRWHGLEFGMRSADSPLALQMETAAERFGMRWFEDHRWQRATIQPAKVPADCLQEFFSRNRRSKLRRSHRKLNEMGDVEFRIRRCGPEHAACAETFCELEAMGWKGETESALESNDRETAFFREMVAGFARSDRAVFTQLTAGGTVVASSSNLISGNSIFAFKIGWHPDYARMSPGSLAVLETLQRSRRELADMDCFDSCTVPGSFVESIWPWRRQMTAGVLATSTLGSVCCRALSRLRNIKRGLQRLDDNGLGSDELSTQATQPKRLTQ